MDNHPPINQLDPFGDNENEFQVKEIRHSRSHNSGNFFVNLINNEDEKIRKRNRLIIFSSLTVAILAVLAVIFVPKLSAPQTKSEPLVDPTGREAASNKNSLAPDDSKVRAYEQEKLNTVFALLAQDDWEYANALFETIVPSYLDACGKYDYYRATVVLAENFEGFSISRDTASARAEELSKTCDRAAEESDQESSSN